MNFRSQLLRIRTLFREKKSSGFTLVETLVAISILSISITGPMLIAQRGIASSVYARDQITAFYLAQDALEYVRGLRDLGRTTGWFLTNEQVKTNCVDSSTGCHIDTTRSSIGDAITVCENTGCNPLSFDTTNKFYGYPLVNQDAGRTWQDSSFTRVVKITEAAPGISAVVSVKVSWKNNVYGSDRNFTIEEYLYNF